MQGLLEGGRGRLQLTLQQPVAALKLPDQPISLHHTTSKYHLALTETLILSCGKFSMHMIEQGFG